MMKLRVTRMNHGKENDCVQPIFIYRESVGLERWTHNFRFQDDPREYDSWEDGISI